MKELLAAAAALPQETMSPEDLAKAEAQERLGQKIVLIETQLREARELKANLRQKLRQEIDEAVNPDLDALERRMTGLDAKLDQLRVSRDELVADAASAVIDRLAVTQQRTEPKGDAGLWKPFAITLGAILLIIVATVAARALC